MNKVLIAGGAGFIGSHLSEKLLSLGFEITVLDNFSTGKMSNLEDIKSKICIVDGDINDYELVKDVSKDIDYIVHEAYPYGISGIGLYDQYIETGILGTFNLLKAAVENNVKKLVNVSSVSAYGLINTDIQTEENIGDPFYTYGVTKLTGEMYCKTFSKFHNLDTVSLRYFYGYGERYATYDHSALVKFINKAINGEPIKIIGSGQQLRDYTYISDIVDGTIAAMLKKNTNGEVYNISGGEGTSILDLANTIKNVYDKEVKIEFADDNDMVFSDDKTSIPFGATHKENGIWVDSRNYVADNRKAKKELDWSPKVSLENGIKRTIDWLVKNKQ